MISRLGTDDGKPFKNAGDECAIAGRLRPIPLNPEFALHALAAKANCLIGDA